MPAIIKTTHNIRGICIATSIKQGDIDFFDIVSSVSVTAKVFVTFEGDKVGFVFIAY